MRKEKNQNKINNLDLFVFKDCLRSPGVRKKVPEHQIAATQSHILELLKLQTRPQKHRPSPRSIEKYMEFLEYVDQEGAFGIFNSDKDSSDWAENLEVQHLLG